MKLLRGAFIVVILLASSCAYDPNDSLEYGAGHTALSVNSINSSNSWFAENSGTLFINHSIRQANASLNLKNRSNLSIRSETAKINISDKLIYHPKKLGLKLADMSTKTAWAINQTASSSIAVHMGESVQAAINSATSGDIIEIYSGTYNENILINKRLTIRGVDAGGGLPIIDANNKGNAIEISADQVILEKIVSTNSSKSSISPGAGVRFSSSNNCSLEEITSYNNYYGINLADSNNNTISESNISNSQFGVRFYFSNNNGLQHSDVKRNNNPLDIVSSEGNIIQGNIFKDNLHELETSKENKIIDNNDIFVRANNESKEVVELNARPRPQPSRSSDTDDDGGEWAPFAAPIDREKEYKNLAKQATGTLVFNPPKVMTREVGEWIDARIGLENTTRLVQGLLGKGEAQFRNISTSSNMTYVVKLEGDNGFDIQAKRPDAQILGIDPAVWVWLVTPLEAGNHTLILSVDLQLEKPPYNCRCINVTYWPVSVKVLQPSPQQKIMDMMRSSYSLIAGLIAFLVSLFSLIMLYRQLKKRT